MMTETVETYEIPLPILLIFGIGLAISLVVVVVVVWWATRRRDGDSTDRRQ
jgi:hypothetical protein